MDVILDVWDLAPGQDKNVFMEQTVNNPEIKKVLLICNKDYQRKADKRQGGVGTESLIMSKEVYAKADQTKFIPIVFESDENGAACVPTFIHSRIFFDLQEGDGYEDNYEQLLSNLLDKPTYRKPPLGSRPAHLEDDAPILMPTGRRVEVLKRAFMEGRAHAPLLVKDYYDSFLQAVIAAEPQEKEIDLNNLIDITEAKIEQLKPLRDDFVNFIGSYLNVSVEFDLDAFHGFLEHFITYLDAKTVQGYSQDSLGSLRFDYLRFFAYELALYLTASLLKAEKFSILSEILSDRFIVIRPQQRAIDYDFGALSSYVATLNRHKNKALEMQRASIVGDMIKQRATGKLTFDEIKQADLVLFYIKEISGFMPGNNRHSFWRTETTVYNTYEVPIFAKLISSRYYEKIKVLFGDYTKGEFVKRIQEMEADSNQRLWMYSDYMRQRNIPDLSDAFHLDRIGTVK